MIAYHYTRGEKLPLIQQDLQIRPSVAGCMPDEVPVVWFTVSGDYPPTAAGGSVEFLRLHGGGAFRIGVDLKHLTYWPDFRGESGIHPLMIAALEEVAVRQGDDPDGWWVHVGPVPVGLWDGVEVFFRDNWSEV